MLLPYAIPQHFPFSVVSLAPIDSPMLFPYANPKFPVRMAKTLLFCFIYKCARLSLLDAIDQVLHFLCHPRFMRLRMMVSIVYI
jgi:hypothetical protein